MSRQYGTEELKGVLIIPRGVASQTADLASVLFSSILCGWRKTAVRKTGQKQTSDAPDISPLVVREADASRHNVGQVEAPSPLKSLDNIALWRTGGFRGASTRLSRCREAPASTHSRRRRKVQIFGNVQFCFFQIERNIIVSTISHLFRNKTAFRMVWKKKSATTRSHFKKEIHFSRM